MFGDNRDKIIINENAYFYKKKNGITVTKNKISETFKAVSSDKHKRFLLRNEGETISVDGKDIRYSICVFKTIRKPNFLIEQIISWEEVKLSYLLIIEIDEYIIIFKKNISKLNDFTKILSPIDYKTLSSLFVNSKTAFESLSLQNTNISD